MDTGIFTKIIEVSPIAGAMIVLVYMFLKAMDKRDDRLDQIMTGVNKSMDRNTDALIAFGQISGECLQNRINSDNKDPAK